MKYRLLVLTLVLALLSLAVPLAMGTMSTRSTVEASAEGQVVCPLKPPPGPKPCHCYCCCCYYSDGQLRPCYCLMVASPEGYRPCPILAE